ncbi:hypothetical protein B0H13DRAFT_1558715, partial [Mycena leptocephala]
DPLASLERTADAQKGLVEVPHRLEALGEASERYNSDPFAVSSKVRKRLREEKKMVKKATDDEIKSRYGLPETLNLVRDDDNTGEDAKQQWARARGEMELRANRKRRRLAVEITTIPSSSTARRAVIKELPKTNPVTWLRARVLENTAHQ